MTNDLAESSDHPCKVDTDPTMAQTPLRNRDTWPVGTAGAREPWGESPCIVVEEQLGINTVPWLPRVCGGGAHSAQIEFMEQCFDQELPGTFPGQKWCPCHCPLPQPRRRLVAISPLMGRSQERTDNRRQSSNDHKRKWAGPPSVAGGGKPKGVRITKEPDLAPTQSAAP